MDVSTDPFVVLADPTRRRLIEALRDGERPVGELVGVVDIQQSGVSRHLKVLHEAGFVRVRKDGQRRLYALQPGPFAALESFLAAYRGLWGQRLDRLDAELRSRREQSTPKQRA